jgi:hypothetical protein
MPSSGTTESHLMSPVYDAGQAHWFSGRGGKGAPLAAATSRRPVARTAPANSPITAAISDAIALLSA